MTYSKFFILVLFCVGTLLLGGCSQADFQPLVLDDPPWSDGEASVYRVLNQNGGEIGTARFDVAAGDDGAGDAIWTLQREISAQGAQELVSVDVSVDTLRPITSTLERVDGAGRETARSRYSSGQVDTELTSKQDVYTAVQYQVPTDARDQRTLLMLLRSLPLDTNYATRVNSYLPIAAQLDRVEIRVQRQEEVTTPAGTFDTWRVRLRSQSEEPITAWVGVESPHPLVKYVDDRTRATFELIEFTPGE